MSSNEILVVHNTGIPDMPVLVPPEMGVPRSDQLVGTRLEQLAELAGRVCYDSLGQGRNSVDWHRHVLEVRHLSVYEHCTFVLEFDEWRARFDEHLLNRPSLFAHMIRGKRRIVVNLRHALEWGDGDPVGRAVRHWGSVLAPQVVHSPLGMSDLLTARLVKPATTDEVWISTYLTGSRIFSHELVRHGDWTAISQRSTRYVDESKSRVLNHPLFEEACNEFDEQLIEVMDAADFDAKRCYDAVYRVVYEYLTKHKNEPADYARKQARSAATRRLPHGLETQMIFSASVRQWNHIFSMRNSRAADAEISQRMNVLKQAIYGDRIDADSTSESVS